jgi:hypothetical protein
MMNSASFYLHDREEVGAGRIDSERLAPAIGTATGEFVWQFVVIWEIQGIVVASISFRDNAQISANSLNY